jgi:hypothetical protein
MLGRRVNSLSLAAWKEKSTEEGGSPRWITSTRYASAR